MPTFLPFLRAVKASTASITICTSILGLCANCLPAGAPSKSAPGPATGPRPTIEGGAATPDVIEPAASEASAAPPDDSVAPLSQPSATQIQVDLPYPADARPRAADPAQAAAEDEELARWNLGGSSDPNSISSQASFHPGTRVVVDTRPAKRRAGAPALAAPRGLSYQRVQAQARSHGYWPFRLCFERGQRDKKGAGGETRVAFTINSRGKVSAARLLDSKLDNAASAACLVREVQKLEFTPAPASKLRMVALIQVYPGDVELPVVPDAAALASLPRGEFDPETVRARVTAKQGELDACFSDARRTDPALWGRLALSVVLEMDGSVHRVSEVESHFPNASVTRCAQALVSSVLFPSVNGKPFIFVLPLRLGPNAEKKTGSEETPNPSDLSADPSGD